MVMPRSIALDSVPKSKRATTGGRVVVDSVVVASVDSEEEEEEDVASSLEEEEEEVASSLEEEEEVASSLEEEVDSVVPLGAVVSAGSSPQPTKERTAMSIATTIMRAKNFFMIKVLLLKKIF